MGICIVHSRLVTRCFQGEILAHSDQTLGDYEVLNQVSGDGSTNLNASIRLDRIGGVNRRGLNLQAELRF